MNDRIHASFPPVSDSEARVLILGSMPGEESLRKQQYYAFPRNAFWRIAGTLFSFKPELPYPERLAALRNARIALWDVLAFCERKGSLDSRIIRPVPNEIPDLLERCPGIHAIFCNGGASFAFLKQYFPDLFRRSALTIRRLPSTSPAAAMFSFDGKLAAWQAVREAADADSSETASASRS